MERAHLIFLFMLSGLFNCFVANAGSTNDQVATSPPQSPSEGQDWTSDATFHILGILEQMNSKLDRLEVKAVDFKEDMKDLEQDMKDLEQRLTSKFTSDINHLEERIKLQLLQQKDPIQDKQKQLSGNVDMSVVRNELVTLGNFITENLTDSLDKIVHDVDCENKNVPTTIINSDKNNENDKQVEDNTEDIMSDIDAKLNQKIETKFAAMEADMRSLVANQTAVSLVNDETLRVSLKEVLQPMSCEKGMPATPYSVIYPPEDSFINIPYVCDSKTDGGGWIVFQRRQFDKQYFNRKWEEYKNGFGNFYIDLWLGLDALHNLTSSATYKLRIDLIADGKPSYAEYSTFGVASESENFVLQIGDYSGTAGDNLSSDKWMPFSARDKDNDNNGKSCSERGSDSGWWYNNCGNANLNQGSPTSGGLLWQGLSKITFSEMKMRLVDQD